MKTLQEKYNFIDREFDIAELKLLIDAVESSKFITKSKSEQLVAKLTSFAGAFKGRELKRNLAVDGRIKPENEQIFYIVDVINEAINHRRKIRFQKTEYNIRKEVVLHNNGEKYTFSPYSLKWCFNYESGEYEYIERDGFSIDRGEYVYNWDDSEYRREEEEQRNSLFDDEDDD